MAMCGAKQFGTLFLGRTQKSSRFLYHSFGFYPIKDHQNTFEYRVELHALFQLLYNCYKKQKQFELALQMSEQYLIYADSVLIDKNKTAIVSDALQADYKAKLFYNQLLANKKEAQLKLKQIKSIFFLILIGVLIFLILFFYFRFHIKKNQAKRDLLLDEIEKLKNNANKELLVVSSKFELVREKIEHSISRLKL